MNPKLSDYEKLKERVARLGLVIPGTIRETYLLCGKAGCACADNDSARHGPYYLWNRKVNGKLTSKSISKDKLPHYEGWLENRRLLEEIVQEMLEIGSKLALVTPRPEAPGNSKKLAQSKRGT
jgi:uncharacterized protein DUF6788